MPRKPSMITRLRAFMDALGERTQQALQVIDEALASDNLKERIWAVDWILKRTADRAESPKVRRKAPPSLPSLRELDDETLLARIRDYLHDEESPS